MRNHRSIALAAALTLAAAGGASAGESLFGISIPSLFGGSSAQKAPQGADVPDPQILVVGFDVSSSNPLLKAGPDGDKYRASAAQFIGDEIKRLPPYSMVVAATFGESSTLKETTLYKNTFLDPAHQAEAVAKVSEAIKGVPQKYSGGQPWTYITEFLPLMAQSAKELASGDDGLHTLYALCRKRGRCGGVGFGQYVRQREAGGAPERFTVKYDLLSDGVESQKGGVDLSRPAARTVQQGRKKSKGQGFADLPAPKTKLSEDGSCRMIIYGIGLGGSRYETQGQLSERLSQQWSRWAQSAGCEFHPVTWSE